MIVVTEVEALRRQCEQARTGGLTVGLVPTMGFFHDGHRSLMRAAHEETDLVVVTLFVNPTQFGPNEDLAAYPRDLERDSEVARAEDVDVLFAPSVAEMYPEGEPLTRVHVARLTEGLCGASRPGHFDGVTTVVAKLFSIVGRCDAFFGRKDYQQLAVIQHMARDLNMPVKVHGCPLVRESDGVAMSSRNAYLEAPERQAARVLSQALRAVGDAAQAGEREASVLEGLVRDLVGREPLVELEYAELRDARTLEPRERLEGAVVLAVAASVGRARLIDNVVLTNQGSRIEVDLGVRTGERGTPAVP